mmetsp:Transcript_55/g.123  ORF Transcript_55/g.123 Transcript_55/m.123 type:complete len:119 (-) Transcript_55:395-751(-)
MVDLVGRVSCACNDKMVREYRIPDYKRHIPIDWPRLCAEKGNLKSCIFLRVDIAASSKDHIDAKIRKRYPSCTNLATNGDKRQYEDGDRVWHWSSWLGAVQKQRLLECIGDYSDRRSR